jgi:hypothetical protein
MGDRQARDRYVKMAGRTSLDRPTVIGKDGGELLHVFTRRIDRALSPLF